jgi:hypothetical protein
MVQDTEKRNKPVGDRDHEVLGMRSFGEYTTTSHVEPIILNILVESSCNTLNHIKPKSHFLKLDPCDWFCSGGSHISMSQKTA